MLLSVRLTLAGIFVLSFRMQLAVMFGRYSIYKPGLIYAGGEWNAVYGDFQ